MLTGLRFSFIATVLAATASISAPSSALALDEQNSIWKVPVIYVTDRQPLKKSFGPQRLVEKDTVARLQSGIVEVCVKQENGQPLEEWQKSSNLVPVDVAKDPEVTLFNGDTVQDLNGGFDEAVKAALKKSSKKEIFVFVHGFNNSFSVAATNAAELGKLTGCPVVLYSWPSVAKVYRYSIDECNNEWSQEHFNQFLEHLMRLKQSENLQLSIVAHSMGNRLFVRAIPLLSGKGLFSDIYMVNPDFDAQTFVHYLSRYIPPNGLHADVRAQLLISRKDNALSAAEALFGGYTRLGQGVDFTLSALTAPQRFCGVWAHAGCDDIEKKTLVGSDEANIVGSIKKAIRVFDVTAFDHGLLGHKVPHEFIAWLHHANQAPPGFTMEMTNSKGGNRFARLFAGKEKHDIGAVSGDIWMVTRANRATAAAPANKQF